MKSSSKHRAEFKLTKRGEIVLDLFAVILTGATLGGLLGAIVVIWSNP